ncbi:MAG TPA: hypothetical protein VES65_05165, partial [Solirubrobacteraceae bacterium]|nr:hypothetical protein [Solirubrobacteraceae bacterium]
KEYEVEHYTPKTEEPVGASKETCATIVKLSGKITSGSTEVTGLASTAGLAVGTEVAGSGIPAGTKITSVKSATIVVLNNKATKTETTTLTFTTPTGYEYRAGQKLCVEKGKAGYTYHEPETLYAKSCQGGDTYGSKGFCEYENKSSGCDAENMSAAEDPNKWGYLEGPVIDAAILSTHHSFIVDNFKCGKQLGELNVWGSIAQFWRGPVGTGGGAGTGYIKNYNYDNRLATEQPPNFLTPSTNSWKSMRVTAPPNGFEG